MLSAASEEIEEEVVIGSSCDKPPHESLSAMLDMVQKQKMPVSTDNNCCYYAVSGTCDVGSIQHCLPGVLSPHATSNDRMVQSDLRSRIKIWLGHDDQQDFRVKFGAELVWCRACGADEMKMDRRAVAAQIERIGRKFVPPDRLCSCDESNLEINKPGIAKLSDEPEWAGQVALRALAAIMQHDIVVIRSSTCHDSVALYPCDGPTRLCVTQSWTDQIVPRLLREQAGEMRQVSVRVPWHVHPTKRIWLPERKLCVLVWNGVNHYDGTSSTQST